MENKNLLLSPAMIAIERLVSKNEHTYSVDTIDLETILSLEIDFKECNRKCLLRQALELIYKYQTIPKTDEFMNPYFYYSFLLPQTLNFLETNLLPLCNNTQVLVSDLIKEVLYYFFETRAPKN